MKQVNIVIRANNKKSQSRINNKASVNNHMKYLYRHADVLDVYSSGLNQTQFLQLLNGRTPAKLIISPAKECDMKNVIDKTIEAIKKYNCLKKLDFIAYIHHDTDHIHAHLLILPPRKKDFLISTKFIQQAVYPEINSYLEKIFGQQSIEEQRQAYIDSAKNIGQAKVDYDIKRLCNMEKQAIQDDYGRTKWVYNYTYNPEKEKNIESWKLDYIHSRINQLVKEKIAQYDPKTNKITFSGNFIMKKIVHGKIQEHIKQLPSSIDPNSIILRYTPENEIAEVLSVIEKPEKHTMSRIVLTKKGTVEFNEKKIKKSDKKPANTAADQNDSKIISKENTITTGR